jgi:membrane associated rhomboid family serine protease
MRYEQLSQTPPLTKVTRSLIVTCVVLYFVDFTLRHLPTVFGGFQLDDYLGLVPARVAIDHWYWQFVTYIFLHGHPLHILLNMLILWYFGAEVEQRLGTREFVFYFFFCGIGAGIFNFAVNALVANPATLNNPIVGASGAIFGLLAAYGLFFGDRYLLVFFLFPMQTRYFVLLVGGMELVMGIDANGQDNVAHFAHVGGLFVGGVYIWLRHIRKKSAARRIKSRSEVERERLRKQFTLIVNPDDDRKSARDDDRGGPYWN